MTHHYVLPWPPSKNRLHRAIARIEGPEYDGLA